MFLDTLKINQEALGARNDLLLVKYIFYISEEVVESIPLKLGTEGDFDEEEFEGFEKLKQEQKPNKEKLIRELNQEEGKIICFENKNIF